MILAIARAVPLAWHGYCRGEFKKAYASSIPMARVEIDIGVGVHSI